MVYPDGTWLKGEWKDGVANGKGTLYSKDSNIIESGNWINGNYAGKP